MISRLTHPLLTCADRVITRSWSKYGPFARLGSKSSLTNTRSSPPSPPPPLEAAWLAIVVMSTAMGEQTTGERNLNAGSGFFSRRDFLFGIRLEFDDTTQPLLATMATTKPFAGLKFLQSDLDAGRLSQRFTDQTIVRTRAAQVSTDAQPQCQPNVGCKVTTHVHCRLSRLCTMDQDTTTLWVKC